MKVEIIKAYPPMIEEIDRAFHTRGRPIIYTWGTRVFNPMGVNVPGEIIAHESVHSGRQTNWTGRDDEGEIERWWHRYIDDAEFRLEEEIYAHKAEYQHLKDHTRDRNQRHRYLQHVAQKLAAPLYGNIITPRRAAGLLMGGA
ncbi:hypothetical protein UFOVP1670_16 [uncultured Caudovirales phage]|uniref:Uncharacterized protein n=1 Tax=uncultured Caudovirales phage TaxID=2100421 RepID=A0A6J5T898_9CAUD|nr:hypothetical protein UFOVP1670_16 [uncultured Caudovirales phage]